MNFSASKKDLKEMRKQIGQFLKSRKKPDALTVPPKGFIYRGMDLVPDESQIRK